MRRWLAFFIRYLQPLYAPASREIPAAVVYERTIRGMKLLSRCSVFLAGEGIVAASILHLDSREYANIPLDIALELPRLRMRENLIKILNNTSARMIHYLSVLL